MPPRNCRHRGASLRVYDSTSTGTDAQWPGYSGAVLALSPAVDHRRRMTRQRRRTALDQSCTWFEALFLSTVEATALASSPVALPAGQPVAWPRRKAAKEDRGPVGSDLRTPRAAYESANRLRCCRVQGKLT